MYTIKVRNVNEALVRGIKLLEEYGCSISPRGMATLEMPCPVTTTYERPCERVLLIQERDANPYFHLFESLWILAGRNDVGVLKQFNSNIANYSDDGKTFHAAYGQRLRNTWENQSVVVGQRRSIDQIYEIIKLLKKEPDTRRAVLQIWDHKKDLNVDSKDLPCNDLIMFKIRNGRLNMTVCNRSNDIIWGAYGANVVQFSMLQEYIANKVGVKVGVYNQISDSFHAYLDNPQYERLSKLPYSDFNPYRYDVSPYALGAEDSDWDADLAHFMMLVDPNIDEKFYKEKVLPYDYKTNFFLYVVLPMYNSWLVHKMNKKGMEIAHNIKAEDWRMACTQWLAQREET